MKKLIILILILIAFIELSNSNITEFAIGARARSLGNLIAVDTPDGASTRWNPATLSYLETAQVYFTHTPLWLDTKHNFFSYQHPFSFVSLSLAYSRLDSGSFIARTSLFDDGEEYSISHQVIYLGFARQIYEKASIGLNIKYVRSDIYTSKASGIGLDLGLSSTNLIENLSLGLVFINIVPPVMKWRVTEEKYPGTISFTGSYPIWKIKPIFKLDKKEGKPFVFGVGSEYEFKKLLNFRAGWNGTPRLGLGLKWKEYSVNYAFMFHELDNNHSFDFTWYLPWLAAKYEVKTLKHITTKDKSRLHWNAGVEFYDNMQYEEALNEWTKAIIWDPNNLEFKIRVRAIKKQLDGIMRQKRLQSHMDNANQYYADGRLKESLEEWEEVLIIDPANTDAYIYIKKIHSELSEKEKLKIRREINLNKDKKINTILLKGRKLIEKEKIEEALDTLEEVFKYDSENQEANNLIYEAQQRRETLISHYLNKGITFRSEKNYSESIKNLKQALLLRGDPDIERLLKKVEDEAAESMPGVDKEYIDKLYYEAAEHYFNQNHDEAMKLLNNILRMNPNHPNALKLKEKVKATLELMENE